MHVPKVMASVQEVKSYIKTIALVQEVIPLLPEACRMRGEAQEVLFPEIIVDVQEVIAHVPEGIAHI